MRILIAADGSEGDVAPALVLAKRLQTLGHDVHVAAPLDFVEFANASGIAFSAVGASIRKFLDASATDLLGGGLRFQKSAQDYLRATMQAQFEQLPQLMYGADRVIYASLAFAAPSIAEHLKIPHRFVAYSPRIFPSGAWPPALMNGHYSVTLNRALWRISDVMHNIGLGQQLNIWRKAHGLNAYRNIYRDLMANAILAADDVLFPLPPDVPFAVTRVPALLDETVSALPDNIERFLERGPTYYVGFGSMPDATPAQTFNTIRAAAEAASVRVIVAAGWANLHSGNNDERLLQVDHVSHQALFQRVAGVVHHGGAGTTTRAARAGVPQCIVPHLLDQFHNAERVAALRLGPPAISRKHLTATALARAFVAFSDAQYLRAATSLAATLRKGLEKQADSLAVVLGQV